MTYLFFKNMFHEIIIYTGLVLFIAKALDRVYMKYFVISAIVLPVKWETAWSFFSEEMKTFFLVLVVVGSLKYFPRCAILVNIIFVILS